MGLKLRAQKIDSPRSRQGRHSVKAAHPHPHRAPKPIVITGGPCGGKTTILRWLARRLKREGWRVYTLPEAARLAISIVGPARTPREKLELQILIVRFQLAMEDAVAGLAPANSVILADRGVLDSKAYLSSNQWRQLRLRMDLTEAHLRERYRAVLHLTSCATDKIECYRNDSQRQEPPPLARKIDRRIWEAWRTHSVHLRIDNKNLTLRQKGAEVLRTVFNLAVPNPAANRRLEAAMGMLPGLHPN